MKISEAEVKKNITLLRASILRAQKLTYRDIIFETLFLSISTPVGVEIVFVLIDTTKGNALEFRPIRFFGVLGASLIIHSVRLIFLKKKWESR